MASDGENVRALGCHLADDWRQIGVGREQGVGGELETGILRALREARRSILRERLVGAEHRRRRWLRACGLHNELQGLVGRKVYGGDDPEGELGLGTPVLG